MAIEKEINGRIIHKHDIEENWKKAVNFIPKKGELIIYDADGDIMYERIKVGDGVTAVSNLPFYLEHELNNILIDLQNKVEVAFDDTNKMLIFTV
jgi:hypothetical protein